MDEYIGGYCPNDMLRPKQIVSTREDMSLSEARYHDIYMALTMIIVSDGVRLVEKGTAVRA